MTEWLSGIESLLTPEQFKEARSESEQGGDPGRLIVKEGLLSVKQILAHLSAFYDRPSIFLERYHPEDEALTKVPEDVARKLTVLPLFLIDRRLFLATSDPEDLMTEDYIRQLTGLNIELTVALKYDIEEAINRNYLAVSQSEQFLKKITDEQKPQIKKSDDVKIQVEDADAPVIKLLNHILMSAVRLGASDIHIEPFANRASLRYRIDGVLHDFPPPPTDLFKSVVSRIKIVADMDIAEKRLPQDGRSSIEVDSRLYDLRISIIPNLFGESVVIRVLDTVSMGRNLENMGFETFLLKKWRKIATRPHGIVLVTGPTGSGKSTTLYATMKEILKPDVKIVTLEDPVEFQLDGVTQFQINSEIGFTFARGLRSILRHDPDIVMLGEIRDLESAEIAVRASLTGHLLFSTLHTNDSASAITRLVDMGIQPYMIMASLLGVLAQRLIRRLCNQCKKPGFPTPDQILSLGLKGLPDTYNIYEPKGCPVCNNLGYKGRIGIGELLEINQNIRKMPKSELTQEKLKSAARESGFTTLFENAVEKAMNGVTSIEEALSLAIE
ncbi:MAG: GspE/PulE family protein [Firmicutes bacterium]|nr:GspE/PulE family protein [Bacillota bacterium]